MDRKSKVEHGVGDKAANGENRSKEEALGKIHQMEWMRNKKEPWHLARSRGENVQEKKKCDNEEGNYFEGTGNHKTKKSRRPRQNEGHMQPSVPPGFSLTTGPSLPPSVNAWSQKKGSALFSKPSDEVDEEDEMLKLALEESLKTAEEDKKRHREREMRLNVKAHSSIRSPVYAEKEYEEDLDEEETYKSFPVGPVFVKRAETPNLSVVETDLTEDAISHFAKKKSAPLRTRKTSSPRDEFSAAPVVNEFFPHKSPQAPETFPRERVTNENSYEVFEPSRPHKRISSPLSINDTSYDKFEKSKLQERFPPQPSVNNFETSKQIKSYLKPTPQCEVNRTIVIPEKDETIVSTVCNLSTSLKSTLTFGDTQGLLENNYSSFPQKCQLELNEKNKLVSKSSSSNEPAISVESTDTDYILHRFIRHDPPSSLMTDATPIQRHELLSDMFTPNSPQQYLPSELKQFEQHQQQLQNGLTSGHSQLAMIDNNGQDSSSSMSDSPLQNVSPYGSFEKQMSLGAARSLQTPNPSVPYPFPYPLNVQGNQETTNNIQAMQLTNQNFVSQMPYPNIPQGYIDPNNPIRGMLPVNPQLNQMSGLPQYSHSNLMMPSLQGQDLRNLSPQLYHPHLHLLAMNAANQYQQAQLAALNIHETKDSLQKEQINNVSQPQVTPNQNGSSSIQALNQPQLIPTPKQSQMFPTQNLPQMIPTQNQPQMFPTQNLPQMIPTQNQPQMFPTQNLPQMIPTQNQPQMFPTQNLPQMIPTQNQPHMFPTQNLPQMIPTQNQPQMFPTQNLPQMIPTQNQPQMIPVHNQHQINQTQDTSSPKQDLFLGEYQQQVNSQNKLDQGMPQDDKSKEDLMFKYHKYQQTLETLNQLQQELAGSQLQSCPIQIPQPQSFAYHTYPMAMGMNHFYQGLPAEAQQQLNQHVTGTGQTSPNTEQDQLNMPRLQNVAPEVTMAQVPSEPQVGRGRGRFL